MEEIFNLLLEHDQVISEITERNGNSYNLTKSAEESSELTTVLLQKYCKPDRVSDQEIIDEVGDVFIRLVSLSKILGEEEVKARLIHKLTKFKEYNTTKRYDRI